MTSFTDDHERAAFVSWCEETYQLPPALQREYPEILEGLLERGWTRHGYCEADWCPPGKIYDVHYAPEILDPDDPRAIAGIWRCICGFETDRLVHADGHMNLAREGRKLSDDRPDGGPHEVTEIARYGPQNREWGD